MITGSVSLANMRLSIDPSCPFVDFLAADVLNKRIGRFLEITDSAGKKLVARILAKGTGETLSATELVTNGDFASATGWITPAGWGIGSGVLTATTAAATTNTYRSAAALSAGALYRASVACNSISAGTFIIRVAGVDSSAFSTTGTKTADVKGTGANPTYIVLKAGTELSAVFDNYSLKQIITPSATGVTVSIISNEGINVNDVAGYTYKIKLSRKHFNFNAMQF